MSQQIRQPFWDFFSEYYVDWVSEGKKKLLFLNFFFPESAAGVRNTADPAFGLLSAQLMFGLLSSDLRSPMTLQPAAEATLFITPPVSPFMC